MKNIDINKLLKEAKISFSRSRGKGGQNLNKVETKVELVFNVSSSKHLDDDLKFSFIKKFGNKLDRFGNIRVVSQTERSQIGNRRKVIEKFAKMIEKATEKDKIRIKTVVKESANEERLSNKKKHSLKKKIRSEIFRNEEYY